MSARKAKRRPPKAPPPCFFTDDLVPVAFVGTPVPCPWCASTTVTILCNEDTSGQGKSFYLAFAECKDCGGRAPEVSSNDPDVDRRRELDAHSSSLAFLTMSEAAHRWNRRRQP